MEKTLNANAGTITGALIGKLTKGTANVSGKVLKETVNITGDVASTGTEILSAGKSIVRGLTAALNKGATLVADKAESVEQAIVAYDPKAPSKESDEPGFLANMKAGFLAGFNS